VDCQLCLKVCTSSRRSRRFLKLCRQFWQCRGKLNHSNSDSLDRVLPLHTQHATLMRKRVSLLPNMSHRLLIVEAITWILQTLEWDQIAPRTGVEAAAGCLVPAPTTDLGLADPILSLFEDMALVLVSCSRRAYRGM